MDIDDNKRFILLIALIALTGLLTLVNPPIGMFFITFLIFGTMVVRVAPLLVESYRNPDNEERKITVIVTGLLVAMFFVIFARERET